MTKIKSSDLNRPLCFILIISAIHANIQCHTQKKPDITVYSSSQEGDRLTKKITYTGLYYYLAHFSKFVRPGAWRINTGGDSRQLNFAGFQNPDGSIVVNIINNGEETGCAILWKNKMATQTLAKRSITTLKWNNPVSGI
jgi:O-glycosyl hydrolase